MGRRRRTGAAKRNERLCFTFVTAGVRDAVALEEVGVDEVGGRTSLRFRFAPAANREARADQRPGHTHRRTAGPAANVSTQSVGTGHLHRQRPSADHEQTSPGDDVAPDGARQAHTEQVTVGGGPGGQQHSRG